MLVYILTRAGVRKGPRKLPSVDSTTVRAWLPCACRVITTLLEMVVGTQPMKISPTSRPGAMKEGLEAHALTMPNMVALVMRKQRIWT